MSEILRDLKFAKVSENGAREKVDRLDPVLLQAKTRSQNGLLLVEYSFLLAPSVFLRGGLLLPVTLKLQGEQLFELGFHLQKGGFSTWRILIHLMLVLPAFKVNSSGKRVWTVQSLEGVWSENQFWVGHEFLDEVLNLCLAHLRRTLVLSGVVIAEAAAA